MSETSATAQVRGQLADLIAPLRERLAELDAEIATHTAALTDLKGARADIAKTIAFLDPEDETVTYRGRKVGKKKASNSSTNVAPETADLILNWMREHRDQIESNGGFSGPSMMRNYGFDLVSKATLRNALNQLHTDGLIRLDHAGVGGEKFYRLVG